MFVKIVETATHVFEVRITPDTPGRCERTATVSILSGTPLTVEEWQRAREQCVRDLIAAGLRVRRAGFHYEPDQDQQ